MNDVSGLAATTPFTPTIHPLEWADRLAFVENLVESELSPTPSLTNSEALNREADLLAHKRLSEELTRWVHRYTHVGQRDPYLWTWCRQGVEVTTLTGIAPELVDELSDTKVLSVMFDVLLDDVADQGGEPEFLEQLLRIPFGESSGDWSVFRSQEQAYATFAEELWCEIQCRIARFPRYEEFRDLARYDYRQLLNTMRYAHLLNRMPSLLNMIEHDLYLPHNMHMIISGSLDLMCSPGFNPTELGVLREALWHAQYMGRIGNLVTTWQRELGDRDFTSGVFARAVAAGDVTLEQLQTADPSQLESVIRNRGHEEYFLARWRLHRQAIVAKVPKVVSLDLAPLVHGLERLICLHLASRGHK